MLQSRVGVLLAVALLGAAPLQAQARAKAQQASLVLYKGQWMRKYDVEQLRYIDYVRAHGYVHYFGKWRPKADVRKLRRDARRHMNRLASSSAKTRDRARANLHKMARKHEMPRLAVLADRVHQDYGDYWRRYRIVQERRRYTVTMGINFQHTELLGLDTVPVSLGTGRVQIQLPRTRSVSIGTTVTVPAGIGR